MLYHQLGLRFATATATDLPQGFEMLYHFSFDPAGEFYSIRVLLEDKRHPKIASITPMFPAAEWIEREIWELVGIDFPGHPNLTRLLLDEDWPQKDYPLRRSA